MTFVARHVTGEARGRRGVQPWYTLDMLRIALALALLGCSSSKEDKAAPAPTTAPPTAAVKPKDPAAARDLITKGATVIDVRTTGEFEEAHLPQATNIPVDDLGGRLAEVDALVGGDKTKPVVVYCASGARSRKAQQQLEAAGYTQVVNGGGYDDLAP